MPPSVSAATRPAVATSPTRTQQLFRLWCELTGGDPAHFDAADLAAFASRPEVAVLATTPDAVLRDAAGAARRGRSLPLERWLVAVRIVRPAQRW
ncbi:MAG: hypothetical protein ACRDTM_15310 [Micromonosporaceae bacterium]